MEIEHFAYECAREDKLMAVMAILKLGLVRKKALIFVNTVDRVGGRGRSSMLIVSGGRMDHSAGRRWAL